ncbi:MAG: hypothetical protein D6801_00355 [Alphaproteobacteria bacterium]|nr:MAG: hypothetical protein D6801_00355 [Alphaproteobacteria bacterium]
MTFFSIGDLASAFQLRQLSGQMKADMTRLVKEVSTGQKQDLRSSISGDFGPLAAIERSLTVLKSYSSANAELESFLSAAQTSLEDIQGLGRDISPGLLQAADTGEASLIDTLSTDAQQKLSAATSRLNLRFGGRSVFAGAASDSQALVDGKTLLQSIKAAVAGETTVEGFIQAVDDWFDTPGGGFESDAYLGSTDNLGPFPIGDGETLSMEARADDPAIREFLKGLTLASLAADASLPGNPSAGKEIASAAATRLMAADGMMTQMRADLGVQQARLDEATTKNGSQAEAFELAKSELISADPYETATELQAVRSRLETLYAATARIADLSFTDFMR